MKKETVPQQSGTLTTQADKKAFRAAFRQKLRKEWTATMIVTALQTMSSMSSIARTAPEYQIQYEELSEYVTTSVRMRQLNENDARKNG